MWAAIISAFAGLVEWWTGKKKADEQTLHDAQVRTDQSNVDALRGESDALKQVDSVALSVDAGGLPVASDPNNRNR